MVTRKCYRCKSKSHLSGQCSLPKRNNRIDHNEKNCLVLRLVIQYLSLDNLLECRRVSKTLNHQIEQLCRESKTKRHAFDRQTEQALQTILQGERYFERITTGSGKLLIMNKLISITNRTKVGKANVHQYRLSKGFQYQPITGAEYKNRFPNTTPDDHEFYAQTVFPIFVQDVKTEFKLEVKALKGIFKFVSLKSIVLGETMLINQDKYKVVLNDKQFIRRVQTMRSFLTEKINSA